MVNKVSAQWFSILAQQVTLMSFNIFVLTTGAWAHAQYQLNKNLGITQVFIFLKAPQAILLSSLSWEPLLADKFTGPSAHEG